ncbi:MAG: hypothetical protein R3B70_08825 [Polyangiaceae bacterium]
MAADIVKIAFVFNCKTDDSLEQAEFDAPETVEAIRGALASGGHDVVLVEMPADDSQRALAEKLRQVSPDIVFNTAEGSAGVARESFGPLVFESLGIPFAGTGSRGCVLTLDKQATKDVVEKAGVRVVPGRFARSAEELARAGVEIGFPVFVKPNFEGSSKGISRRSVCRDPEELRSYGDECLEQFPEGVLVEQFVPGRDIGVPFIAGLGADGVLEPVEYALLAARNDEERIYDYDLKNVDDNALECVCPAPVSDAAREEMMSGMRKLVPALGIADFARADFRVATNGDVFFLEVNALPSLQPGAGIFVAAARHGLDYAGAILQILAAARARYDMG